MYQKALSLSELVGRCEKRLRVADKEIDKITLQSQLHSTGNERWQYLSST